MDRDDILDRLHKIDMEAFSTLDDPYMYKMVIVGGSGLILLGITSRVTFDIDAIEASPEIIHILEKYDANINVKTYIDYFPYNFDDRLVKLDVGGLKIQFYSCSLEDMVIAKLFSQRPEDRQDIISDEVVKHIDWDILSHLALDDDEAKASVLNERRYSDFLSDYYEYIRRFGPHEGADV